MGCENCALRECEGRNGMIVCELDGESHKPDYVCDEYEPEQKAIMNAVRIESEANEIAERYTNLLDRTLQKQVTGVQLNSDGTWTAVCTHTDYDPLRLLEKATTSHYGNSAK